MEDQSGPERRTSGVVGSSPRQERLASVSFGRNTDRLSKRHEATAKTNLKCLLTKQSELAALPAHEETGAFAVYSSLWLLSSTVPRYHYSCPIPLFSTHPKVQPPVSPEDSARKHRVTAMFSRSFPTFCSSPLCVPLLDLAARLALKGRIDLSFVNKDTSLNKRLYNER
ncbi:hypothetical protein K0M31_006991 [Melipona bicolor]|uniref:Uncharacterized protein n=1 Tax=Melipona bicolor TaxID=60889 RepID=A0AA40FRS4_9HYME|nr:hypothetical protein K0M31_006991 [Melipona bicolor]